MDDDPVVREIIHDKLSAHGLDVVGAASGSEALKWIEASGGFCLIILDIMMPGMSGFEVCERIRLDSRTANTPVLFLTSRGEPSDRERAMRFGAFDFIIKPFSPQRLADRILTILNTHSERIPRL